MKLWHWAGLVVAVLLGLEFKWLWKRAKRDAEIMSCWWRR